MKSSPTKIASCLAAAATADPFYAAYGNALVGPSGISAAWPTAVGFGRQSTVYGARPYAYGKRSADADADAFYGYGYGLPLAYGRGVAAHPGVATSFTARSPQGLHGVVGHYYGKRSADADAFYGYYGHGVGIYNNNVYSGFTGNHYANGLPGRSFAAVTRGKRSADAEADAFYGYGNALVGPSGVSAAWPTAVGYGHQSTVYGARPYVYGKRSADAEAEADPYYGYGYGRAYGYGLGYHGYHHGGYYGHGYGHGYGYGYYG